ncbi:hypothetical protein [Nocardia sp. NPDC059228]|uniref:hypothetical protein n=1 Tax=Nocardia sp. NPDC059228 TaxID=3346777 RepID=UPI0036A71BE7
MDPGAGFDLLWQQREKERAGGSIRYISDLPAEQRLAYEQLIDQFSKQSPRRRPRRRR